MLSRFRGRQALPAGLDEQGCQRAAELAVCIATPRENSIVA
jgi:hypothetical protein